MGAQAQVHEGEFEGQAPRGGTGLLHSRSGLHAVTFQLQAKRHGLADGRLVVDDQYGKTRHGDKSSPPPRCANDNAFPGDILLPIAVSLVGRAPGSLFLFHGSTRSASWLQAGPSWIYPHGADGGDRDRRNPFGSGREWMETHPVARPSPGSRPTNSTTPCSWRDRMPPPGNATAESYSTPPTIGTGASSTPPTRTGRPMDVVDNGETILQDWQPLPAHMVFDRVVSTTSPDPSPGNCGTAATPPSSTSQASIYSVVFRPDGRCWADFYAKLHLHLPQRHVRGEGASPHRTCHTGASTWVCASGNSIPGDST